MFFTVLRHICYAKLQQYVKVKWFTGRQAGNIIRVPLIKEMVETKEEDRLKEVG